jgi:hypothetical protein
MTTMTFPMVAASALALLLLADCHTDQVPQLPAEPPVAPHQLGHLVSTFLCELDQQCGRIGAGMPFESVEACATAGTLHVTEAVDVHDACQKGASAASIGPCLDAISLAGCDATVDPGLIPACQEDVVCVEPGDGRVPAWTTTDI